MQSTVNASVMRMRVRHLLVDTGGDIWTDDQIDEALRQALDEFSIASLDENTRVSANRAVALVVPGRDNREISLAAFTGMERITEVWFPYTDTAPEYPPNVIQFAVLMDAGTPYLYLHVSSPPDGTEAARVFYIKKHTISGLDGETETSLDELAVGLIVLGAAGYACLQRSVDLIETPGQQAVATPNLAALGTRMLHAYRGKLAPRNVAVSAGFKELWK